jgi:regulatory protein
MPGQRPGSEREPPGRERALELAGHFLGPRPRSRWEVARRLRKAGADAEVVEATLTRLQELGFVDDLVFARWWLEQRDRHAPRGRRLVEAELRQHGIGRDVIEALREELEALEQESGWSRSDLDASLPRNEEERARVALARHLRGRPLPEDRAALQRLGMFLVRRGFGPDAVRSALRMAQEGADAEGDEFAE